MNYPKDGSELKECLNFLNESLTTEKSTENDENNINFCHEFEKIFCSEQKIFQKENEMNNYNLEKLNLESMIKTIEANLISLEKQIDNLKIINTNLHHINILCQLNDICENNKTNINERIKALQLKEKLVDKLINCVNMNINNL